MSESGDTSNTVTQLEIAVGSMETEIRHLNKQMSKVVDTLERLADIQLDVKQMRSSFDMYVATTDGSIHTLRKDLNAIGEKLRVVEDRTSRNTNVIGFSERIFWIVVAAAIGLGQHYIKV